MQPAKRLTLRLLGSFELIANGSPQTSIRIVSRKGRALMAYLSLQPDHRVSREQLATLLWGDRYDTQARQDLRQCLVSLRRALASVAPDLLVADAINISLRVDDLTIDVHELSKLAAVETPEFERAAALCRGQFLSGVNSDEAFGEWLNATRARFDEIAADIFQSCARDADRAGHGQRAIDAAERLVEIDPAREDWQRLALELAARYRGRENAISRGQRVIAFLERELGTDVEPATRALLSEIRCGAIPVTQSSPSSPDAECPVRSEAVRETASPSDTEALQDAASPDQSRSAFLFLAQIWQRDSSDNRPSLALGVVAAALLVLFAAYGQVNKPARTVTEPISYTKSLALSGGSPADDRRLSGGVTVPVAVLPFLTSGDADAKSVASAEAITDDLTNVLTQNSDLAVLSRRAAATYERQITDPSLPRTAQDVRYIIDGRVRSEGLRLHVNVALIDATSGLQVWSDQFEQDSIDAIVARLARELQSGVTLAQGGSDAEAGIQVGTRPSEFAPLVFAARADFIRDSSRESSQGEAALFEEALRRKSDLPAAQLGLAMALIKATLSSLAEGDPQQNLNRAEALLDNVLWQDPTSYRAQFWKGLLHKARGNLGGGASQYQIAFAALKRALELNPSASYIRGQLGAVLVSLGRAQEGLDEIQYAIEQNPKDPSLGFFYLFAGEAELELGHDEQAIAWLERATECLPHNPSAFRALSATYALVGDRMNMERSASAFRRLATEAAYQRMLDRLKAGHLAASRPRISKGLRIAFASQG
jgi:DNA-binding SARP family transcriptional activator/TolB-like protein/Tfp pilus assembly protein PilF